MGENSTREQKYGQAVADIDYHHKLKGADIINIARAVMAVADAEQAELRAEVAKLRLQNESGLKMIRALSDELMGTTPLGVTSGKPEVPMPHAHCPECLGAIGTHRTTCSLRTN